MTTQAQHDAAVPNQDGISCSGNGVTSNGASKRAKRRARQKALRRERKATEAQVLNPPDGKDQALESRDEDIRDQIDIVYVPEVLDESNPLVAEFADVFKKFQKVEQPTVQVVSEEQSHKDASNEDESGSEKEEEEDQIAKLSNKKLKQLTRLSVAELKQLVEHPEVVDIHDCNSSDPRLLVYLKSYRNLVSIPGHWSQKRKYLQGKRGIEKSPFALPAFIEATGIAKIRQAHAEADEAKKAKARQRERMQPKMNRIDIDYQVLHDAFFRHQTKPKMAGHGDLYFEGKEFQVQMLKQRPGHVSSALKECLGWVEGYPPPWLVNMQRFGPPPSYRNLRIPGLNAPLPSGAAYGYGEGQWGKPPVDVYGNALYGDPFGIVAPDTAMLNEVIDKSPWGEVEEEYEEEQPEEEEAMEEEERPSGDAVSGMDSVASMTSGMQTPDAIELRKAAGLETPDVDVRSNKQLYTVLQQQESQIGNALIGSTHTYKVPTAGSGSDVVSKQLVGSSVNVAISPEELEKIDAAQMTRKYQEEIEAVKALHRGDDLSDVMLEETRKRRRQEEASSGDEKRYKDFKF